MDLLLSLVSLLLVAGGGRSRWQQQGFAAAAETAAPDSETLTAYWRTVLPGVPMPSAISDLLTRADPGDKMKLLIENLKNTKQDKLHSLKEPKFISELRRHGPRLGGRKFEHNYLYANDEKVTFSFKPQIKKDKNKATYNLYNKDDQNKVIFSYKPILRKEDEKKVTYGSYSEDDKKKVPFSYNESSKEKEKKVTHGPHNKDDQERLTFLYRTKGVVDKEKVTFSYKLQDGEDEKKATLSYNLQNEEDQKNTTFSYDGQNEEDRKKVTFSYDLENEEDKKKATISYDLHNKEDQKKATFSYDVQNEKDEKKATFPYDLQNKEDQKKVTISYDLHNDEDQKKATFSYDLRNKENEKKTTFSEDLQNKEDQKKTTFSYMAHIGQRHDEIKYFYKPLRENDQKENDKDQKKVTFSFDVQNEEDQKKATFSYDVQNEEEQKKATISYDLQNKEDQKKATFSYDVQNKENQKKATFSYDLQNKEEQKKARISYDLQNKDDRKEATFSYMAQNGEGHDKIRHFHNPLRENDQKKNTFSYVLQVEENQKSTNGEKEEHGHDHRNLQRLADVFFLEDILKTGSVITPTIPRTTFLPPLLRRDITNSIPFSIDRLGDILSMFAPASLAIADEIRWVLEKCDSNPWPPITDEKKKNKKKAGCTTSMEDLVELPMSLLGTRRVRVFSANMPVEAAATLEEPRGRYTITALRRIVPFESGGSSDSSEMVTCHDMTYPYAVFYCHMAGLATRAYKVALASEVGGGAEPATIEAVAVCHMDTSQWSPKHPFLQALHVKPGDVEACHFLPKSSVVWVPAVEQEKGCFVN